MEWQVKDTLNRILQYLNKRKGLANNVYLF